eukprot:15468995-Alexandrium_andersonii.AAC.1
MDEGVELDQSRHKRQGRSHAGTHSAAKCAGKCLLSLMSWNARTMDPAQHHESVHVGMASGGKVFIASDILSTRDVDVICLQEGKFRSTAMFQSSSYVLYTTAATKGARGVQLWVRKKWASDVKAVNPVSDRLIACSVEMYGHSWYIISVHAPLNSEPVDGRDEFWVALNKLVGECPEHSHLLIGGDFNGRVTPHFSDAIGPMASSFVNANGAAMAKLFAEHSLVAVNTWVGDFQNCFHTCSFGEHRSHIDFVAAPTWLAQSLSSLSISPFSHMPLFNSDHNAIAATF